MSETKDYSQTQTPATADGSGSSPTADDGAEPTAPSWPDWDAVAASGSLLLPDGVRPDLSSSFLAYDVRGIDGETMSAASATAVGAAFVDALFGPSVDADADERNAGSASHPREVLVGGDMRPSSDEYVAAFAAGAKARGADVNLLGQISTDMLYHACGTLQRPGVIFTASHNPAGYNGIKMSRAGAVPISSDTGLGEIQTIAQGYLDAGSIPVATPAGGAQHIGERRAVDTLSDYAHFLHTLVDLSGLGNSATPRLKVVVDAGNGMAGKTTPAVLGTVEALKVVPLYFELDGTFPHHPANPIEPENLVDLQVAVREHGADLGLAFDGDADRCFVVDETGAAVSPSAITGLVAEREVTRARAAGEAEPVVIHNLITSKAVPELVRAAGGRPVRTRVGHSFIKQYMADHGAVFGGEHSAHYYFRDFFNADTGMLAAMHVLAAVAESGRPLSELAAQYSPYASSGEINTRVADVADAVARVLAEFDPGVEVAIDTLDGTTVTARDGSWWFNLRPSNTEPLLRFNAEADTAQQVQWLVDSVLPLVRG